MVWVPPHPVFAARFCSALLAYHFPEWREPTHSQESKERPEPINQRGSNGASEAETHLRRGLRKTREDSFYFVHAGRDFTVM